MESRRLNLFGAAILATGIVVPGGFSPAAESRASVQNLCATSYVENWQHSSAASYDGATGVGVPEMRGAALSALATLETRGHSTIVALENHKAYEWSEGLNVSPDEIKPLLAITAAQNHILARSAGDVNLDLLFETQMRTFQGHDREYNLARTFGTLLCGATDLPCQLAFRDGVATTDSHAPDDKILSFPQLLREFHDNPVYSRAAAALALTILNKIEGTILDDHHQIDGDLFTDTQNAFVEVGVAAGQAPAMAVKLLSLYGMRGADSDVFMTVPMRYSDKAYTIFETMFFVSRSINYLDGLTLASGHPYSLPPGISSDCMFARPYHFWMSAALAEVLRERGHSARASLKAAHKLGVAYEVHGGAGNKDSRHVFDQDFYLIETQKNLTFNDAGAFWVANEYRAHLNIDDLLSTMFAHETKKIPAWAQRGRAGGAIQVHDFPFWMARTGADANIKNLESQLRHQEDARRSYHWRRSSSP
jgi:hypothetical protein